MRPEARARIAEGMRRSWARRKAARLPSEPRANVRLFAANAKLLRALVEWPGSGPSAALSVRALLNATRGKLWRLDRYGHPRPTAALYGPLTGSPRC